MSAGPGISMSGTAPQPIEWYIARDGNRHGPISDVEMRKFVELGHLRPTDLVWCADFTEWKPGAAAFPDAFRPKPAAPPAPLSAPTPPAAAPARPAHSQTDTTARATPAPTAVTAVSTDPATTPSRPDPIVTRPTLPAASPAVVPNPAAPVGTHARQPTPHTAALDPAEKPGDAAEWAAAMRAAVGAEPGSRTQPHLQAHAPSAAQIQTSAEAQPRAPAGQPAPAPYQPPSPTLSQATTYAPPQTAPVRPAAMSTGPAPFASAASVAAPPAAGGAPYAMPQAAPEPAPLRLDPAVSSYRPEGHAGHGPAGTGTDLADPDYDDYEDEVEEQPQRRSWLRRLTTAIAVLLILGGLGWIGWQNRASITGMIGISELLPGRLSVAPPADAFRVSPYVGDGETRAQIDASLQKAAIWRLLKRDFKEWYDERLADVEKMRAQKADEKAISKFLADVIVTLRRRNAQAALQSSTDHLQRMSAAFVANLKQLATRDGATCHGFITFGEAHPFIIELSRTPAFGEPLHRQIVAVFEGIVHGRANKIIHPATRRTDYDTLTIELTARGWTPQDLATFSDPRQLSGSPPDKVCSLVQEWFLTQIALKDTELKARLLAESLKPLTAG